MSSNYELESWLASAPWRRATKTGSNGGNCAEVAPLPDGSVALRNSRQPEDVVLVFTPGEWDAFMDGSKKGEFDF